VVIGKLRGVQSRPHLRGARPAADRRSHLTAGAALTGCDVAEARSLLDDLHEDSLLDQATPERYRMLDPLKEFVPERAGAATRLLPGHAGRHSRAACPFDPLSCRRRPTSPAR
jgi:hypothetical protein